ncbi:MAG: HlyD family secretion protein [Anaerolineae bacterium]
MKHKIGWILRLLPIALFLLAKPSAFVAAQAQNEDTPQTTDRRIIVEGTVTPARFSALQFIADGEVVEVMVEVGDQVQAGDPVARVNGSMQALAVASAESRLAAAQAELRLLQAGPRREDIAVAEANLETAKAQLQRAIAARSELTAGVTEAEIAGVQAELEAARAQRRQAQAAAQWAEDGGDLERRDNLLEEMRRLDVVIKAAEARLVALPRAHAARLRNADASVSAAQAQVHVAEANLALVKAGATDESLAAGRATVQQAQADLRAAEVALARTTLRAPFDGTVTQVLIEVGDAVGSDRPALVLADLSHLRIETTDLTELDVVHVREGQPVEVTIDAIPGEHWQGHVDRIKQQSLELSGDIVYPAIIELEEASPTLRWGMTVAVTFLDSPN